MGEIQFTVPGEISTVLKFFAVLVSIGSLSKLLISIVLLFHLQHISLLAKRLFEVKFVPGLEYCLLFLEIYWSVGKIFVIVLVWSFNFEDIFNNYYFSQMFSPELHGKLQ